MELKTLRILGTRGIPAAHGGFETFAEHLALYLVAHGWRVVVYCQEDEASQVVEDDWQGVERIHIAVKRTGPIGTIVFDWLATAHAARYDDLCLTLGYNTAAFCLLYRLKGIPNIINMDGIEWKREKWSLHERLWLRINERLGCWFGNNLIADHPAIANHLASLVSREKITMIPYGANEILSADESLLNDLAIEPGRYAVLIARAEPENSVLEIVRAFSCKQRKIYLVVLGQYEPINNSYHRKVLDAASEEVIFPGAIYDKDIVEALRFFGRLYIHGHKVGGTNPSLVEALGAGSAVLAHDNRFNRWVAGDGAHYFASEDECASQLDKLLDDEAVLGRMSISSQARFHEVFTWENVLGQYERLLISKLPKAA